MGYSWEDVMLNIDVRDEAKREKEQQQDIMDKQAQEESAMGMWSLGLSIVGGALLGPAGYAAGKIIGRGVGDIMHDWEKAEVSEGKFYKDEAAEFKKTRDKAAKDQTSGQILNAVTDIATMYVQAGGLEEGLGADFTTFGASGTPDEWSVLGRGTGPTTLAGEVGPEGWSELYDVGASADYVPSLLEGWGTDKSTLENIIGVSKTAGSKLQATSGQASSVQNLINTLYKS